MTKRGLVTSLLALALTGCVMLSRTPPSFGTPAAARTYHGLPRPAHVVVVWEENKAFGQIVGNPHAPYINRLARHGALMARAFGVTHPSEPNYLAFFSGSTHGLHDDDCPYRFHGPNLATRLTAAGYSFKLYAEGLPHAGDATCGHGEYARKHNAAADYPGLAAAASVPFRRFPHRFSKLPTVSWVIPDLVHDMHSASVAAGDRWLKKHIGPYVRWARHHDSLLIIAWDEDDYRHHNHIPLILVGPMVRPGRYRQAVSHYSVLRTLEAMYRLKPIGQSARAVPITKIWKTRSGNG